MRLTPHVRALIGCSVSQLQLGDSAHQMQKLQNKFEALLQQAAAGGGPRGHHRHCVVNKKLAPRKRLSLLFDSGEYYEISRLAGYGMPYGNIPAAGSIVGIGFVSKRLCIASVNDATVKGGTIYPIGVKKTLRKQEVSGMLQLPTVYLVDSGGAFLPLQSEIFPDANHGGRTFYNEATLAARGIPQLALVLGSSTAGGAYVPTMCEEAAMVEGIGHIFLGGPPLVQAALGEMVTADELGGAWLHSSVSGCSDHFVKTEQLGFELMRDIVGTLPKAAGNAAADGCCFAQPAFPAADLNSLGVNLLRPGERRSALMNIIARLIDCSYFTEFKPLFGESLVCGFGRVHGRTVGLIGSCGSLQERDAVKGAHFVQLCQQRKASIVFLSHTESEAQPLPPAAIAAKARMMALVACFQLPKLTVIVGDAAGCDHFLMCGRSQSPTFLLAWPNARIGRGMGYGEEGEGEGEDAMVDAFTAAGQLWIDDVVLPADTREHIHKLLQFASHYNQPSQAAAAAAEAASTEHKAGPVLRF